MSITAQAKARRSRARVNRPKGLRGQSASRQSRNILSDFAGKVSKTAKKSGGK